MVNKIINDIKTQKCRSCNADIFWCLSSLGKNIPIDAEPVDNGNLYIVKNGFRYLAISVNANTTIAEVCRKENREKYISHFATCPHANQHRKIKKGETI